MNGTVRWFESMKGYGFIAPDGTSDPKQEVFVHIAEAQRIGLETLREGQRLSFDVDTRNGANKRSAVNLKVLNS
ncbi:cold-shock protein [Streptomyces klenkii]